MVIVMSDYINREDTIKAIESETYRHDYLDHVFDIIEAIPSADVAPVRHGRWKVIDAEEPRRYGCSECKRLSWHMENYCGNCGARMDAKE